MKKYKVILTESEMRKLKHLVNEKINDDDVDVNVGGARLHKNLKRGDNYLKKMIIDLLKSETDFNVRMDMAGDIVVESYAMLMCYIEIDSDGGLIDLTFATEEEAKLLKVEEGQYLYYQSGVVNDDRGVGIEFFRIMARPDQVQYTNVLTRRDTR